MLLPLLFSTVLLAQTNVPPPPQVLVWPHGVSPLGIDHKDVFVNQEVGRIDDDHQSFLTRGVPSVDIIDLNDYISAGYWHTPQDTLDKISPRNVAIVGYVVLESVGELQKKFK